MKIKPKYRIGGFDWKVRRNRDVTDESGNHASCHFTTQTIFLEPSERGTEQHAILQLFHEVGHAIAWHADLMHRLKDTPDLLEDIVQTMSQGYYQWLRDNKMLKD